MLSAFIPWYINDHNKYKILTAIKATRAYLVVNTELIRLTSDGKKNGVPQSERKPNDIISEYTQYSKKSLSFFTESMPVTINDIKNTTDMVLLTPKARFTEFMDLNAVDKSITTSSVHIPSIVEIIIRFPCLYEE